MMHAKRTNDDELCRERERDEHMHREKEGTKAIVAEALLSCRRSMYPKRPPLRRIRVIRMSRREKGGFSHTLRFVRSCRSTPRTARFMIIIRSVVEVYRERALHTHIQGGRIEKDLLSSSPFRPSVLQAPAASRTAAYACFHFLFRHEMRRERRDYKAAFCEGGQATHSLSYVCTYYAGGIAPLCLRLPPP